MNWNYTECVLGEGCVVGPRAGLSGEMGAAAGRKTRESAIHTGV